MFEQIIKRCDDLIKVYQGKKTEIERAVSKAIADLRASDATFRASFSGILGVHKGVITVGGRADRYYPVQIKTPSSATKIGSGNEYSQNLIHRLSINRGLSTRPIPAGGNAEVPYNGNHWLSTQFEMEFTGGSWDGGANQASITNHHYSYRRGVAAVRQLEHNAGDVVIWLRGGGTGYTWSASYPINPVVHCEDDQEKSFNRIVLAGNDHDKTNYGTLDVRINSVSETELDELEKYVASANTTNFPNWAVTAEYEHVKKYIDKFRHGRILNGLGFYQDYMGQDTDLKKLTRLAQMGKMRVLFQAMNDGESKKADGSMGQYAWGIWLRSRFCRYYHQVRFDDIKDVSANMNYNFDNTKYTRMTPTNPNGDVGIT